MSWDGVEKRFQNLETSMDAVTKWQKSIDESIAVQKEMIAVGKDIAAALRVLGWIGEAIKWLAKVSVACAAIWLAVKGFISFGTRL